MIFLTDFLIRKFIKNDSGDLSALRSSYGKLGGFVGIACNLILFVIKLSAGIISKSVAITADSINNLSDAGSSVVTMLGFKISEMPPDEHHPYGHGRIEYLSGLFISVFIFIVGAELFKSSIQKIFHPEDTIFNWVIFFILSVSVILKLWLSFFNNKLSKKINSSALMAAGMDSRNDAVITLSVLLSAVFTFFTKINIDGYVGLVVAVFIFISGIDIMKDTINPLLGQAPDKELLNEVANKVLSTPGIMGMHDFIIHDYGPGRKFASLHAEMDYRMPPLESHDIIDNIEKRIKEENNIELVIHYDPIVLDDPLINKMKNIIKTTLREIDEHITMHDLRMVKGSTHVNWVFDIVIPPKININSAYVIKKLKERIASENEHYNAVITVDSDYSNDFNFK